MTGTTGAALLGRPRPPAGGNSGDSMAASSHVYRAAGGKSATAAISHTRSLCSHLGSPLPSLPSPPTGRDMVDFVRHALHHHLPAERSQRRTAPAENVNKRRRTWGAQSTAPRTTARSRRPCLALVVCAVNGAVTQALLWQKTG
jgi:hypothetical protein